MVKKDTMLEIYLKNNEIRKNNSKQYVLTQKNIEKIRKIALKEISYPEHKDAYEYVDSLFPSVGVKNAIVHKVMSKDLCRMGLAGVEGFYDPVTKIVVISGVHQSRYMGDPFYKIEARVEQDEVIVHELCHYCYVAMNHYSSSMEMIEEFAYGWSIGYLREKGYSDEYIIKYNFLPYLMSIFNAKATKKIFAQNGITCEKYHAFSQHRKKECDRMYRKKVFILSKEMAIERGKKIIELYTDKLDGDGYANLGEDDNEHGRYGMLDL